MIKPTSNEIEFQKAKRIKKLRLMNYTEGNAKLFVDVDDTNRLTVYCYPEGFDINAVLK